MFLTLDFLSQTMFIKYKMYVDFDVSVSRGCGNLVTLLVCCFVRLLKYLSHSYKIITHEKSIQGIYKKKKKTLTKISKISSRNSMMIKIILKF